MSIRGLSRGARRSSPGVGLASAGFALAIAMLGTPLPTPLYSLYRERFGISELIITVIFATYAAGVIASLLLFGRLSDQVGRRRMLLPGLALAALSAIAFLTADGLALLLAGRVLAGLSAGIFTGTATATLVDLAGPERRARATLMATIANMCGLGCGPLLAGMLAQWAGSPLRLIFWVYLVLLIPATIGIWVMPEPVAATSRPRLRPQAQAVPTEMRTTFVEARARRLRRVRGAWPVHRRGARLPGPGARGDEPRRGRSRRLRRLRRLHGRAGGARAGAGGGGHARRMPRADRRDGRARARLGAALAGAARARWGGRGPRPWPGLQGRDDSGEHQGARRTPRPRWRRGSSSSCTSPSRCP
ncbi:MAG: hypothetical protein QOD81_9 [Solirubrobacteraceae bacterium]|nr:hypothetical protein [Solirubrobacteraceae bacterium]